MHRIRARWQAFGRNLAIALSLALAGPALHAATADTGGKVALVIGNSGYDGGDRLLTPVNDAKLIGDTFRGLGFDTRISDDQTQEEFKQSVDWLAEHARGAQVAVFYYAGHGFASHGSNFLVPVKTGQAIGAMTYADLLQHAVRLEAVRTEVNQARPLAFVSLIDACREPSRGATTSHLKTEPAAHGELIAYSTADQSAAFDSMRALGQPIDDSPFAWYLATYLRAPGATLKQALDATQQQVSDLTKGQQLPWISSGLVHDIRLGPASDTVSPNMPNTPNTPARPPVAGPNETPRAGVPAASSALFPGAPEEQRAAQTWTEADQRIALAAQTADRNSIRTLRARKNDPAALTTLGEIAENGYGGTRADPRQAIAWYQRAAARHYPVAETLLGEIYGEGKYVERDYALAEKLLARAAGQHDTRAELDLAQIRAARGQAGAVQDLQRAMLNAFGQWTQQIKKTGEQIPGAAE